jgi:hypothetical protein
MRKRHEFNYSLQKEKRMTRISNLFQTSTIRIVRLVLLAGLITATPMLAQDAEPMNHTAPAQLVDDVRDATRQFLDVNNAVKAGYAPAFGCVSGSDHGAMGIHYVNGALVGDGEIVVAHPEALIYEPAGNARLLVGVEFIVDAATWLKNHNNTPPSLEGQDFQFVAAPNRFNLPDFFELHVWAWRDNPQGAFVDWNNEVTCERQ